MRRQKKSPLEATIRAVLKCKHSRDRCRARGSEQLSHFFHICGRSWHTTTISVRAANTPNHAQPYFNLEKRLLLPAWFAHRCGIKNSRMNLLDALTYVNANMWLKFWRIKMKINSWFCLMNVKKKKKSSLFLISHSLRPSWKFHAVPLIQEKLKEAKIFFFSFGFCLRKAFNSNYSQKLNTMNKMRSDAFMSYFLAHSCCIIHSEQTQRSYRPSKQPKANQGA